MRFDVITLFPELFGAHSHYGLGLGEDSCVQVVEARGAFLEANGL